MMLIESANVSAGSGGRMKSRIVKRGLVISVVLLFSTTVVAATLDEVKRRGRLTVLCFPHQDSEFVSVNLDTGPMPKVGPVDSFRGLDVDLMAEFARRLGVAVDFRAVSEPNYGALIPDLLAGRADIIASSFTITENRAALVDFSLPYFRVFPVVVAREETIIWSIEDLRDLTIAVISGSANEEFLRGLGWESDRILPTAFTRDNYVAVLDREADAALVDSGTAEWKLPEHEGLVEAFRFDLHQDYGFAVPPGSDLLEPLNEMIEEMKHGGELARLLKKAGLSSE